MRASLPGDLNVYSKNELFKKFLFAYNTIPFPALNGKTTVNKMAKYDATAFLQEKQKLF